MTRTYISRDKNIQDILRRIKKKRFQSRYLPHFFAQLFAGTAYNGKMITSLSLLSLIESLDNKIFDSPKQALELKSEARKNCLINCVTAVENFFQYKVFELINLDLLVIEEDDEPSLNLDWTRVIQLIREKNKDLEELLFTENLHPAELIISTRKFTTLEEIDHVFTRIFGKKFLDQMENMEVPTKSDFARAGLPELINKYVNCPEESILKENDWKGNLIELWEKIIQKNENFILKKHYPKWREELSNLLALRNEVVHNFYTTELTKNQIANLLKVLDRFIRAADYTITKNYEELTSE